MRPFRMNTRPPVSSRTSSPRRISRSATTPITTTRSTRRDLSGTMCCSTTRSSAIILGSASSVKSHLERNSSWARRITASAAPRRIHSTSSAARGRKIPRRTWRSFRARRHDHRQRRVDRAREHHHARCEDRRRRDHRRLFCGGEGRPGVHRLRRKSGKVHQGAI